MSESRKPTDARLLALDVSSSAVGYAVFSEYFSARPALSRFGVLRATKSWQADRRVDRFIVLLDEMDDATPFTRLAMERTTGQTAAWLKKLGRRSVAPALAIAQGRVIQWAKGRHLEPTCYTEKEWTRSKAKAKRAQQIALEFPAYAHFAMGGGDDGLDAADAIGIGLYWIAQQRMPELAASPAKPKRRRTAS